MRTRVPAVVVGGGAPSSSSSSSSSSFGGGGGGNNGSSVSQSDLFGSLFTLPLRTLLAVVLAFLAAF